MATAAILAILVPGILAACGTGDAAPATALPTPAPGSTALSADPLPPEPALEALARECATALGLDPGMPLLMQDRRLPDLASVVLQDAKSHSAHVLIVDRSGADQRRCPGSGGESIDGVQHTDLAITSSIEVDTAAGGRVRMIDGHAPHGVAGVQVVLDDGSMVTASVAGDRFVAMWNADRPRLIVRLVATDVLGAELARVDDVEAPSEALEVTADVVSQRYDADADATVAAYRARVVGRSSELPADWSLTPGETTATWTVVLADGQGRPAGTGVDITITLQCADLRRAGRATGGVDLHVVAGTADRTSPDGRSASIAALGTWFGALPDSCP